MREVVKLKLQEVGALLLSGFTTGTQARDADGSAVPYDANTAVKWTLEGAIAKACPNVNKPHLTAYYITREILNLFGRDGSTKPYRWNPPTFLYSEPSESPSAYDILNDLWEGPGTSDETRLAIAKRLQEIK